MLTVKIVLIYAWGLDGKERETLPLIPVMRDETTWGVHVDLVNMTWAHYRATINDVSGCEFH